MSSSTKIFRKTIDEVKSYNKGAVIRSMLFFLGLYIASSYFYEVFANIKLPGTDSSYK